MIHRAPIADGREIRTVSLATFVTCLGLASSLIAASLAWGYTRGTITHEYAEAIGERIGEEVRRSIMETIAVEREKAAVEHREFRRHFDDHDGRIQKLEDWRALHVDGHASRR